METKKYLFRPDKKFLKQGFYMTDADGKTVYEAQLLKQSFFKPLTFKFINHITGTEEQHEVTHTITTETNNGGITDIFTTNSRFKYDGMNIWDYLHEEGIRIDSHKAEGKLGMAYDITFRGLPFAKLVMTNPSGKGIIPSRYCFDVETSEENLDLVFLVTFAIARTEQTFYS